MTAEPHSSDKEIEGIQFIKGAEPLKLNRSASAESGNQEEVIAKIRESLAEAMNARNVAFLMGAGCSSLIEDGNQVGIPIMRNLAKEFTSTHGVRNDSLFLTKSEKAILESALGIDIKKEPYKNNLEVLMETLYSWRFSLSPSRQQRHKSSLNTVERCISKLKKFLFNCCTSGPFSGGNESVQKLYEAFYRKLIFRDRSLPRPWIFTTNYDLFNETAMDRMWLPYSNGFIGAIERRFNPSVFRYALAEQLDVSSKKWTAVDGFVYLCKLHGSISWVEDGQGLFPIREVQKVDANYESLMIYPTPAKQSSSFSSPYADLFREFQSRIVREQSVLFVIGYSFADEHVNNIIYQALTVPTFRLIIFSSPESQGEIGKLRELKDSRIWIIGGKDPITNESAHYLRYFVDKLMPDLPGDKVDKAVQKVLANIMGRGGASTESLDL